ncbi:MAG: hypothetical protein LBB22_02040 [Treponema sp.]|nr:hypothetical protein [Treponema sp.]
MTHNKIQAIHVSAFMFTSYSTPVPRHHYWTDEYYRQRQNAGIKNTP